MTQLKTIPKISKQKEILVNENTNSLMHLSTFSLRENLNGLTVFIRGGVYNNNLGNQINIDDKIINLSVSNTHYIYFNTITNLIENNTTGFSNGNIALYTITTNTEKIINIIDNRKISFLNNGIPSNFYVAPYVLPKATSTIIGGVKPDGGTIVVDGFGTLTDITNSSGAIIFNTNLNSDISIPTLNTYYNLLSLTLTPGTYYILYFVSFKYTSVSNNYVLSLELTDETTIYSHSWKSTYTNASPITMQNFNNCLITLTETKTLTLKAKNTVSTTTTKALATNNSLGTNGATRMIALKL